MITDLRTTSTICIILTPHSAHLKINQFTIMQQSNTTRGVTGSFNGIHRRASNWWNRFRPDGENDHIKMSQTGDLTAQKENRVKLTFKYSAVIVWSPAVRAEPTAQNLFVFSAVWWRWTLFDLVLLFYFFTPQGDPNTEPPVFIHRTTGLYLQNHWFFSTDYRSLSAEPPVFLHKTTGLCLQNHWSLSAEPPVFICRTTDLYLQNHRSLFAEPPVYICRTTSLSPQNHRSLSAEPPFFLHKTTGLYNNI